MNAVTGTINQINVQTLTYLPAVIAGVHAAEVFAPEGATGQQKLEAVLAGISAGSAELANSPNQTVAEIAILANLTVSIANIFGAFKHKAPAK